MTDRFERGLSVVLVVAALAIAAGIVHREFFAPSAVQAAGPQPAARFGKDWQGFLSYGEALGDTSAPVKVVEFSDIECPYCKTLHKNLLEVLSKDPHGVVGYFVHFPNEGHRFAFPAARAAECARAGGRFGDLVKVMFAKQDSLGLESWGSYALDAGITDTNAIRLCATQEGSVTRIASGLELGRRLGVTGTPTVIYNGWRLEGTLSRDEITRVVDRLKKGKAPFDGTD